MTDRRYTVEVQPDFIKRQSGAKPISALAEMIWNGLDADATKIDVQLSTGELGLTSIVVRDNGHGIPHSEAPGFFRRLGGSWKRPGGLTKTKGRFLHGSEGRGRFKAFALGRVAVWKVTYLGDAGLSSYTITMIHDNMAEVRISDERPADGSQSGAEIEVSELHRQYRSLDGDGARQELTETFARYLKEYSEVSIFYKASRLDPEAAIQETWIRDLGAIEHDGQQSSVSLEIIQWQAETTRALYLCTEQGLPLSRAPTRFHVGDFQFSAYLRSAYVTSLHSNSLLDLAEMDPGLQQSVREAREAIGTIAKERQVQRARRVVDSWKADEVYPFKGDAKSPLEEAERQVFDMVAVTASDFMPEFESAPAKKKAFDLRMLKTALEKSPEDLQIILNEVLDLPKKTRSELADLLQETSLAAVIGAAKVVADRLKFLAGLELILFDKEMQKRLKERSQLHQILAENTWIFGEEYALSVSDRSLTEVLRKHRHLLSNTAVIDEPVKHVFQTRGIVDLMLSRALPRHRADELEHLVVELKAPRVKLGNDQLNQIQGYAFSVMDDERFNRRSVRWSFWVISDAMDRFAEQRILENEQDSGTIFRKGKSVIAVKTWAEVIDENKARLQFFQERLQHQVGNEEALTFLQEKYSRFLEGVVTGEDSE